MLFSSHSVAKMLAQKGKHQSYSFKFKLKVTTQAEVLENQAAAREFQVDKLMICYWQKKKPQMEKLPKLQCEIWLKARDLMKQMNIAHFVDGQRECYGFMHWNHLSVHTRTTVGQALPDDWKIKEKNFQDLI